MTKIIRAARPVIRTITMKWLQSQRACDDGKALFRYLTGEHCLMSFCGDDFVWMQKHFEEEGALAPLELRSSSPYLEGFCMYECFTHVRWLYRRISINSSALKTSLLNAGVDIQKHELDELSVDQPAPRNWRHSSDTYYHLRSNTIVSLLVPDGVPLCVRRMKSSQSVRIAIRCIGIAN